MWSPQSVLAVAAPWVCPLLPGTLTFLHPELWSPQSAFPWGRAVLLAPARPQLGPGSAPAPEPSLPTHVIGTFWLFCPAASRVGSLQGFVIIWLFANEQIQESTLEPRDSPMAAWRPDPWDQASSPSAASGSGCGAACAGTPSGQARSGGDRVTWPHLSVNSHTWSFLLSRRSVFPSDTYLGSVSENLFTDAVLSQCREEVAVKGVAVSAPKVTVMELGVNGRDRPSSDVTAGSVTSGRPHVTPRGTPAARPRGLLMCRDLGSRRQRLTPPASSAPQQR